MAETQSNTKRKFGAAILALVALAGIVAVSIDTYESSDKKQVKDSPSSSLRTGEVQAEDESQLDNDIYGWIPSSEECMIGTFGCSSFNKKNHCKGNSGCAWSKRTCITKSKCRCYDVPQEGCSVISDKSDCKDFIGCSWQKDDETCEMLDECIPVEPDVGPRPTEPIVDANTTEDLDQNGTLISFRFLDGNETDVEEEELLSNSTTGELAQNNSTDDEELELEDQERTLADMNLLLKAYLEEHRVLQESNETDVDEVLFSNSTDGELVQNNSTDNEEIEEFEDQDRALADMDLLLKAYLEEHRVLQESNETDVDEVLFSNSTDGELVQNNSTDNEEIEESEDQDRALADMDLLLKDYLEEHRVLQESNETDIVEEELLNNSTDVDLLNNNTEGGLTDENRWENITDVGAEILSEEQQELENVDAFIFY